MVRKKPDWRIEQPRDEMSPLSPATSTPRWGVFLCGGIIVLVGIMAFYNSFGGVFVFDDNKVIKENPSIRQLWPPQKVISAEPGTTSHGRPVLAYSLAINYAISGLETWSYHAVNLAIHLLGALTLFGLARRTLLTDPLRERFGKASLLLSLGVAMIWTVHPLQTMSVTYIVQRAEAIVGLFYLLCLYCAVRGASSPRPRWWYSASVVACALGMASKEVMVTAPVIVLLYDRTFLGRSFREALRRRWGLYIALGATWGILGVLLDNRNNTVGFGMNVTSWEYTMTTPGVILRYLRLSFFPSDLCLDYRWPFAKTIGEIHFDGVVVVVLLLALTAWALFRRPMWGFVGAWFFIILSPTTSFIPISDALFEQRMYLSLAGVITAVVIGGYVFYGWVLRSVGGTGRIGAKVVRAVGVILPIVVVAVLGVRTVYRNEDFHNLEEMWQDVVAKRPNNYRAQFNIGVQFLGKKDYDAAIPRFRNSVRLKPSYAEANFNLAFAMQIRGNPRDNPQIVKHYYAAIRAKPDYVKAMNDLAWLLATCPEDRLRNGPEAVRLGQQACKVTGYQNPRYLDTLAAGLAESGQFDKAIATVKQVIRLASKEQKTDLVWELRQHLELYENGRPFRNSK